MADTKEHAHELIDRLPPTQLSAVVGLLEAMLDPVSLTIADGILDRLVHNAHRIELRGESLRKTRAKKPETKSEA